MAVTKRTRFEVLRRDNHTCQYCGAKAPDVTLHIDHVVPVALGGDDNPGNLATACRDCNSGKASISPDSPLVQQLSEKAAAYALGMLEQMKSLTSDLDALDDYEAEFQDAWGRWNRNEEPIPLPNDYRNSLFRWMVMGVPVSIFELVVPTAMEASNRNRMPSIKIFAYMAGVIWKMLEERKIDRSTRAGMTESEKQELYEAGWHDGVMEYESRLECRDLLARHIDGRPQTHDGIVRWSPSFAEHPWREGRNGVAALAGLKDVT